MPVCCVLEACYQQLIHGLRPAVPKSLSMIAALKNVQKGRLKANFFVDKWPDFTALVCQYLWPRRSDVADIGAYAMSSEALLSVLTEGNLVTWGKRQEFQRIEDRHADYLLKHLKPPGVTSSAAGLKCVHERSVVLFNKIPAVLFEADNSDDIEVAKKKLISILPDGYMLGKLQSHHAGMVASQWPRQHIHGWPNKEPYMRELIKSYYCPALYSVDNLNVPVSYVLHFPCNQLYGHTDKEHRGSKLSNFPNMMASLYLTLKDGFLPFEEETSHPGRVALITEQFGGVLAKHKVKDLVIDYHGCEPVV